jgi:hypothetical protein
MNLAGSRNLCLAGGVALNCVGNGRILRESGCDGLWIQPAAGDGGGALGAALAVWHRYIGGARTLGHSTDAMRGSLLGPSFGDDEIDASLLAAGARADALSPGALADRVAELLAGGKICGWFQGRAEFGPRALGARSILADPRDPEMQSRLNLRVKERESFRPFAPAVLLERAPDWFDLAGQSPYMLLVAPLRERRRLPPAEGDGNLRGLDRLQAQRSCVPAVTHVDFSARVQTVGREAEPGFRLLLEAFERRTGCPVLVNTSFNGRDEPMVLTPRDAIRCFRRTGLDFLVLGRRILLREGLPESDPLELPRAGYDDHRGERKGPDPVARARAWNLLGLCTPFANLGMLLTAPRELRWFGTGTGVLLLGTAAWAWLSGHAGTAVVATAIHILLVLVGLLNPHLPEVPGSLWLRLGATLGRWATLPIFALLWFGVVTPTALLVRIFGRDPLARHGPRRDSYWIPRMPSPPERFERQY